MTCDQVHECPRVEVDSTAACRLDRAQGTSAGVEAGELCVPGPARGARSGVALSTRTQACALRRTRGRRYNGAHLSEPITCDVDGIPVRLTYKKVRNVTLRISRDGSAVEVSAPLSVSFDEVAQLVSEKRAWIESGLAKAAATPAAQAENATATEIHEWREVVSACVPVLVEAWEPIMGVKAGSLVYRNMKSRWGSCQPATGRICINIRLALYPPECLEYVVVHELCHLLVPGHGKQFHALMDKFMPDWKERRAKLR